MFFASTGVSAAFVRFANGVGDSMALPAGVGFERRRAVRFEWASWPRAVELAGVWVRGGSRHAARHALGLRFPKQQLRAAGAAQGRGDAPGWRRGWRRAVPETAMKVYAAPHVN